MIRYVVVALVIWCGNVRADVERYAVIIGNNAGARDEQTLRFAESDADHVGELLVDLGGVPEENQTVLRGKPAERVRRALIATNERIRTGARDGRTSILFVYYSGHGDADSLHLADSRFELRELEALVRGSPAQIRVLVIDACRSGAMTRVKGGTPAAPIALTTDDSGGEGIVVLTASTAGEDAQESDELGSSFFTHFLLSGLRGAADDDGDRTVTISEAFRYARDETVLASSRTLRGMQHPTFHYDLRGRSDVVLSDLGGARGRGQLTLPDGATWLVSQEGARTFVVGEIGANATRRTLSLRPGRYQVRGRTRDALLEGSVSVERGRETRISTASLVRSTYARLVRKGHGRILTNATSVVAGPILASSPIDGAGPCAGAMVGLVQVRSDLTLSPRVSACRGSFENETLSAVTTALSLDLRIAKAWDVSRFTVDVGVTAGARLLHERFTTAGEAPPRLSAAAHVDAGVGFLLPIGERWFTSAELAAQSHFFRVENEAGEHQLTARFAFAGLLAIGAWL
jgi:hypothetical protein